MTSKERAAWRAKANSLEPIIQLGKEGISDNLITQIDDTLDARELIKIRVHLETAPEGPKELAQQLAHKLQAEVIQVIGGIIVLYREADEERIAEKKKKRGSGKAKATAKKKVKIKGMRQRQREKEEKNPYAIYDRPKYRGNK
ncbi:MAG: ribosome assembly RNA-binding protein YhbY [Eubacterium sp.]|nr:ribosome assembly RNA-binding protein YhbY [Eubacterium sp.]